MVNDGNGSRPSSGSQGGGRAAGGGRRDAGKGAPGRSGRPPAKRGEGARRGAPRPRTASTQARPDRDERPRIPDPPLSDDIRPDMLDPAARARLRTLSKDNSDVVAKHLVAAGRAMDSDPETAYLHAKAAFRRAGRVDVVREAVALTAYATERYAEALRELRTVRRLSGVDAHRAVEADCERGLGRPERALALAASPEVAALPAADRVELAIVSSGARLDLGEPEAALLALDAPVVSAVRDPELAARVAEARAAALGAMGRTDEARRVLAAAGVTEDDDEFGEVVVIDLEDEEE